MRPHRSLLSTTTLMSWFEGYLAGICDISTRVKSYPFSPRIHISNKIRMKDKPLHKNGEKHLFQVTWHESFKYNGQRNRAGLLWPDRVTSVVFLSTDHPLKGRFMKYLYTMLLVVASLGLIVGGCSGDDDDDSTSEATSTPAS